MLVGEDRELDTCFAFAEANELKILKVAANVSPLAMLPIRPADLDIGGLQSTALSARGNVKAQALETVTRWNALEHRLATLLANHRKRFPTGPGKLKDPRLVAVLLTGVPGILREFPDEATLVRHVPPSEVEDALALVGGRMKKKVLAAREALDGGVRRVVIGTSRGASPLQRALEGRGTVLGEPLERVYAQ